MKGAIVVNGDGVSVEFLKSTLSDIALVIAVDGGMHYLEKAGVKPHIFLGDMDSYSGEWQDFDEDIDVLKLPTEKDMSDLEFAFSVAIKKGVNEIILLNALGKRVDHLLTNLNVLRGYSKVGIDITLIDEGQRLYLAKSHQYIKGVKGKTFSIIPLTDLKGVTLKGVKYPLQEHTVSNGSSLCLSNEAIEDVIEVTILKGAAFIVIIDRVD